MGQNSCLLDVKNHVQTNFVGATTLMSKRYYSFHSFFCQKVDVKST